MVASRIQKLLLKFPDNEGEDLILEFSCSSSNSNYRPLWDESFEKLFKDLHKSNVLQKDANGPKFILDPTAIPLLKPNNDLVLSQFGVDICSLFKRKPTQFELIPRNEYFYNEALSVDVNTLPESIQKKIIIDITFLFEIGESGSYRMEVQRHPLETWKRSFNSYANCKFLFRESETAAKEEIQTPGEISSALEFSALSGELINTRTSMVFEVKQEVPSPPSIELIEAFKAKLSDSSRNQLNGLKKLLLKLPSIIRENAIYAPYMPLIQSSGYGKSKLTDELLRLYPGIPIVFRNKDDSGYPLQAEWVTRFRNYVYAANKDVFPADQTEFTNSNAIDFTQGRFLFALFRIIQSYFRHFSGVYGIKNENRADTLEAIGNHFLATPEIWLGHEVLNFDEANEMTTGTLLNYISVLLKPTDTPFHGDDIIFDGFTKEIVCIALSESENRQFLILMDELSSFDKSAATGRLSGVHIVRRALHLLNNPKLFVIAIGTNSDSWDFSPAVRDNSLRYPERKNLLAPAWLSGNGDIFFIELRLYGIEFGKNLMLNRNYMKVFLSMGRPLWSSLKIDEALSTAMIKMKNGSLHTKESLISYLLCRASMRVSPSSVLTRSLVRSHMATVHFIDSDARSMKISYPSEPVLAFSARELLSPKATRTDAFKALAAFTQRQVIDRGRMVETIHEHMVLFAIDDTSPCSIEYNLDNSAFQSNLRKVLDCQSQSFLLSINFEVGSATGMRTDQSSLIASADADITMGETADTDTAPVEPELEAEKYLVIKASSFLETLFGPGNFSRFSPFLDNYTNLMNGYINASHFINFEESGVINQYFGESKTEFKIDRSLLKLLLMRSAALVLPPNQFGLDFVVPVLLATREDQRPVYSYIGFQSKSSMSFDQFDAVAKTNMKFSLRKCVQTGACSESACQGGIACYSDDEFKLILEYQLSIVMSLDHGDLKRSLEKVTVRVDSYKSNNPPPENVNTTSETGRVRLLKEDAIRRARTIWPSFPVEGYQCARIFPKVASFNSVKPNLIFKKTFRSEIGERMVTGNPISVQRMVWDAANDQPYTQSLTCIISHDIINHQGLLQNAQVCQDIKNMVNDQISIFTDIPQLHLDLVVDSCVNGPFSTFDQFNPGLRAARGIARLHNPLEELPNYTSNALNDSIMRCINRNNENGEPP